MPFFKNPQCSRRRTSGQTCVSPPPVGSKLAIFLKSPDISRLFIILCARFRVLGPNTFPNPLKIQSGFTPRVASNRSSRTAGARSGGCAASPRWVRMRAMAADSSMAAISFSCPPQCEQCAMSTTNTRFPTIDVHLNGRLASFE